MELSWEHIWDLAVKYAPLLSVLGAICSFLFGYLAKHSLAKKQKEYTSQIEILKTQLAFSLARKTRFAEEEFNVLMELWKRLYIVDCGLWTFKGNLMKVQEDGYIKRNWWQKLMHKRVPYSLFSDPAYLMVNFEDFLKKNIVLFDGDLRSEVVVLLGVVSDYIGLKGDYLHLTTEQYDVEISPDFLERHWNWLEKNMGKFQDSESKIEALIRAKLFSETDPKRGRRIRNGWFIRKI